MKGAGKGFWCWACKLLSKQRRVVVRGGIKWGEVVRPWWLPLPTVDKALIGVILSAGLQYWWCSQHGARLPYSQCVSKADTGDLHQAIGIFRTDWHIMKNKKSNVLWTEFILSRVIHWSASEMLAMSLRFGKSSTVLNNVKQMCTFLNGIILS